MNKHLNKNIDLLISTTQIVKLQNKIKKHLSWLPLFSHPDYSSIYMRLKYMTVFRDKWVISSLVRVF